MVNYPVFAEPFVLVVIRGALDTANKLQPQVADSPLARVACGGSQPSHRLPQHNWGTIQVMQTILANS